MNKQIKEFCVGCGLCRSEKKAILSETKKGFVYPVEGDVEWLKKICPMMGQDEKIVDADKIWGRSKAVYLGWTNDTDLRNKASSGGILTELASFLLNSKKVDSIIHICADEKYPTRTRACYSNLREELVERCGSRYAISHPLEELYKIDYNKKYAFIGKPCDVIALKNYMKINSKLEKIITYTLSFFCMGVPSIMAQQELLHKLGCKQSDCIKLTYRGNGWPGFTKAVDKNGKMYQMDYDSAWGSILGRDLMPACRFCIDGVGELSDISCGDAWHLDEYENPDFMEHDGRNVIFARTDKGLELIKDAQSSRCITVKTYCSYEDELKKIQRSQYERRVSMKARITALKFMGRPHPVYSDKILKKYSQNLSRKSQLRICIGTCKRIVQGKI